MKLSFAEPISSDLATNAVDPKFYLRPGSSIQKIELLTRLATETIVPFCSCFHPHPQAAKFPRIHASSAAEGKCIWSSRK